MRTAEELEKHKKRVNCCCKGHTILHSLQNKDLAAEKTHRVYTVVPIKCTSYFCPDCAKKKKNSLREKVKTVLKNETWRFLTLTTVKPEEYTTEYMKRCSDAINKLFTNLRRKFRNLKYIKIVEIGKGDNIHYHILVNCYIDRSIIIKYWRKYTGAFIVDIRRVDTIKNIVNYITKYLSKSFGNDHNNEFFFLSKLRRYSFSQSCNIPKYNKPNWHKIDDNIYTMETLPIIIEKRQKEYPNTTWDLLRLEPWQISILFEKRNKPFIWSENV